MIIWIASYPRSGNTYFRIILSHCFNIKTYSIYDDQLDIGADKQTSILVGHQFLPGNFSIKEARESDKYYFIKTHSFWQPEMKNDKTIYILRDGREATVSYYNYILNYQQKQSHYYNIIGENLFAGNWGEHVKSWSPNTRENLLLIKFEQLVDDYKKYLPIISNFINTDIVSENSPNFAKLHETNPKFFRAGKKDSWRKALKGDDLKYFYFKNYDIMKEYDYVIPKSDIDKKSDELESLGKNISYEISSRYNNILEKVKRTETLIKSNVQQILQNNNRLHQKDQQLQQKNQQIQQKDQQLQQKDQQLQQKDQQLQQKDQQLQQKDHQLQQKDQQLQEKNQKLQLIENQLVEKVSQIQKNKNMMDNQAKRIILFEKSVSYRLGRIILSPAIMIKTCSSFIVKKIKSE